VKEREGLFRETCSELRAEYLEKCMYIIIIIIIIIKKIRDNEKGTCMLIDVAISGDTNVIKKEAERRF
jgi:hypothetical protein